MSSNANCLLSFSFSHNLFFTIKNLSILKIKLIVNKHHQIWFSRESFEEYSLLVFAKCYIWHSLIIWIELIAFSMFIMKNKFPHCMHSFIQNIRYSWHMFCPWMAVDCEKLDLVNICLFWHFTKKIFFYLRFVFLIWTSSKKAVTFS